MTEEFTKTLAEHEELFRQTSIYYNVTEHDNGYFTMNYFLGEQKHELEFRPDGSLIVQENL
ncbi:hypothetical protein [Spartinivicinus ruber]|uniref:hypothetical protein n=1 Tax=Spartinivicinus ruber TaxID=2683272 RepID=UPI0013D5A85F|nr:hypothetical protein [Spartinivicinus ruber]